MTFLSYAQNYEDVILWRALKNVQNGFYIDIGANDPSIDSVTKAFYDRGWSGINVEPVEKYHKMLIEARTRDINLLCAAGSSSQTVNLWQCEVRGWATSENETIREHEKNGQEGWFVSVPMRTLSEICEEFVKGEIHFLKIDVEGFEKNVIKGMDFKKFRPWIIVIEATKPNTNIENYHDWEPLIFSNGYNLAYADGLNRFYTSHEQDSYFKGVFKYPPNVFDNYIKVQNIECVETAIKAEYDREKTRIKEIKSTLREEREKITFLKDEISAMRQELNELHQLNHSHWIQLNQARNELQNALHLNHQNWQLAENRLNHINSLLNSKSWRVMAPVRWSVHQVRLVQTYGILQRTKALIKKIVRSCLHWVTTKPKLKIFMTRLAYKLSIAESLKIFVNNVNQNHRQHIPQMISSDLKLHGSRSSQIYQELKAAIQPDFNDEP